MSLTEKKLKRAIFIILSNILLTHLISEELTIEKFMHHIPALILLC